jgi:spore coat polysaccharide biosynthesis protein SpsF (cytidylyltransferase family)
MKEMVRRIKELIEASEPDMTVVKVNGDEPFVPLLTEYVSHDLS